VNDCSTGEGLFYSRRVGRAPNLGDRYGDASSPTATTIIGAGKLTGRLAGGLNLGVFEGVAGREAGTQNRTIEPATNYAVVRVQQDLRLGESGAGMMLTAVNRDLDSWTEPHLRRSAYVGAVDFRHRFARKRYEISGSLDWSRVAGTPQAIAATQRSSVRYYQRPDGAETFDSTRTTLVGDAEELRLGKVGGGLTRFQTAYQRRSPGFEINDLGFLRRADQQSWSTWFAFQFQRPTSVYQVAFWNFNWWQYWTAAGLPLERAANTNVHVQLNNRWWVHAGGTLGQLGSTFCDRCARGGPAVRRDPYFAPWAGIEGDGRPAIVPSLWFNYWRGDGGRSEEVNLNPTVTFRVASQLSMSLGVDATHNVSDVQWYRNFDDGTGATHYTFAHLDQKTVKLTGRVDYTLTRNLTLQVYAQPFVSKGTYANVRELADPRAAAYGDRYRPYTASDSAFNVKQFRSNVVLRWEYRPGSTLFLVWNQGRQADARVMGTRSMAGDFRDLFDLHPDNTLLLKVSYWLER
jgi:hypothetical protein